MKETTAQLRKTHTPGLTGQSLKMIAILSMIIDHIGYAIVYHLPGMSDPDSAVSSIYTILRLIGRIAFPIYCFMLIEGLRHTRSLARYAIRMLIFCLISEIPFNLAFFGRAFYPKYQNVFFTLFIGVLMLWGFEAMHGKWIKHIPATLLKIVVLIIPPAYFTYCIGSRFKSIFGLQLPAMIAYPVTAVASLILIYAIVRNTARKHDDKKALTLCGDLVILSIAALAADLLHTDYRSSGIIAIALMYLYRQDNNLRIISGCIALAILSSPSELFAVLDTVIINSYNGERGHGNKYLFYAVYPIHLLILYLIAVKLGIRGNAIL